MLDKKIEQLSSFIKEIDQMDLITFLKTYGEEILTIHIPDDNKMIKTLSTFNQNLDQLTQKQYEDISEDLIMNQLFYYFIYLLKKRTIYNQAATLGIKPSLFKKEMRFLFKGIK